MSDGVRETGLDRIVFVRRQSPDWDALTRDHEAGRPIDPRRYVPQADIPGFPDDIAECIRIWNATFWVNFFRCRQTLKALSEHMVRRVSHSIFLTEDRLDELPAQVGESRCLVFFYDDDDWFAPDTFERLSALNLAPDEIAVFPLPRLGDQVFTFVREGEAALLTVGARRNFGHRFQTNNYAVPSALATPEILHNLRDHVYGSLYATERNLPDSYYDILISATNKTPCSANVIGDLPADPSAYRRFIQNYVATLAELPIPAELNWMIEPLRETIDLFRTM